LQSNFSGRLPAEDGEEESSCRIRTNPARTQGGNAVIVDKGGALMSVGVKSFEPAISMMMLSQQVRIGMNW
jgi:hypothetical protein